MKRKAKHIWRIGVIVSVPFVRGFDVGSGMDRLQFGYGCANCGEIKSWNNTPTCKRKQ